MNWINKFIEENNFKKQNKAYLKYNMIKMIVENLKINQLDINKKFKELNSYTEGISEDFIQLVDYHIKLDEKIKDLYLKNTDRVEFGQQELRVLFKLSDRISNIENNIIKIKKNIEIETGVIL